MADWIGRNLGKVTVELLIARGGMADIYLGRHSGLRRSVVVKVLSGSLADDQQWLASFQREARAASSLRHPNIVQVYDYDSVEGHPYIIMEYVPGVALSAYLQWLHSQHQRLSLEDVLHIFLPVASALQYAHERGIVHRDIKPGNILLTSPSSPVELGRALPADVFPVLSDFGLVRFLDSSRQTTAGQIAGTPAYMSPEQAGGLPVDQRTDVYSLGIVLYELLSGAVPFDAESSVAILHKHVAEAAPRITGLAEELWRVLAKALVKQPRERFPTAAEFASALENAVNSFRSAETAIDLPPLYQSTLPNRRKGWPRVRWALAGFLGLSALVLGGTLLFKQPQSDTTVSPTASPSVELGRNVLPVAAPTSNGPVGVLRFQDGAALVDEATFNASGMNPSDSGSQYEVWLVAAGGEERRSLGYLVLDETGSGSLTFVDPEGQNLLAKYNGLEISIEPDPDQSPNPTRDIAFSTSLPAGGLAHVKHLLVSFGGAPNGAALVDGLRRDATLIDESAHSMLEAYERSDEIETRAAAEAMLNVLVGDQSPDYLDWNADGTVQDPGDGYGMLLNGSNAGYIQGTYSHANFAVSSVDATDNMKVHGEHVMISARNLEQWAPELRDLVREILGSPLEPDIGPSIRKAVALADSVLAGTDLNGNERIEPIPGEGGAQTAYQHAFYMADIVLTP